MKLSMFPINLRLKNRKVLLVGSGKVGRRKLEKLIKTGAVVTVVEPRPSDELRAMALNGTIVLELAFKKELLNDLSLVFLASSDTDINREIASLAADKGLFVNVADDPQLSDFFMPAVVEDGSFQISISTGGASPALAASVANEFRNNLNPAYGPLTALTAKLRPIIMEAGISTKDRKIIFQNLANSQKLRKAVATEDFDIALKLIREIMAPVKLCDDFFYDHNL